MRIRYFFSFYGFFFLALVAAASTGLGVYYFFQNQRMAQHLLQLEQQLVTLEDPRYDADYNQALMRHNAQVAQQLAIALESIVDKQRHFWGNFRSGNEVDFLLELNQYAESLRALSNAQGIGLDPACAWGFGQYLQGEISPPRDAIPALGKQLRLLNFLLTQLLEESPAIHTLVQVQRERVGNEKQESVEDFFTPMAPLTLRGKMPSLKTFCFQIKFSSTTETLRRYLNLLANAPIPFIVRHVEVGTENAPKDEPAGNYPNFTIMIEFVDVLDSKALFQPIGR